MAATDCLSLSEVALLLKKEEKYAEFFTKGKGAMAALIGLEINEVKNLLLNYLTT